jgi:hypothetical protein
MDLGNIVLIAASACTGFGALWLFTLALPRRRSRRLGTAL